MEAGPRRREREEGRCCSTEPGACAVSQEPGPELGSESAVAELAGPAAAGRVVAVPAVAPAAAEVEGRAAEHAVVRVGLAEHAVRAGDAAAVVAHAEARAWEVG